MNSSPPAPARLRSLDVLRAIAVLLVLGRHMPPVSEGAPACVLAVLHTWERGGWIGVDLFFVLSGFLVAGLLFREHQRFGSIRYGHFLARRGFKIYPSFYIMLGAVIWFAAAQRHVFVRRDVLFSELLFVQNFGPSLFPHTWSLAVEEHFYLMLPLLLLWLRGKARPFAALPYFVATVSVIVLAARFIIPSGQHLWSKAHLFPTYLRIDSLLLGVVLSWFFHFHYEKLQSFVARHWWMLLFSGLALLAPPFVIEVGRGWYLHTLGLTANAVGSGALLLVVLHSRLNWRPLAFIGAYSYCIYLWHMPIRFFGLGWIPAHWPPLVSVAIYFAATIVFGIVVSKLFERPFLVLRDRLFPTRSAVLPEVQQPGTVERWRKTLDLAPIPIG